MTSLIDVIFLLLLFFMLSSTFSRYGEIELVSAGAGSASSQSAPVFLQLKVGVLVVNSETATLDEIPSKLAELRGNDEGQKVVVAVSEGVDSQRLVDLAMVLRALPEISFQIIS